nr:Dihydrofolate reductase [uncultured bacterium]
MIISVIVAMDEERGIGKAGTLPWRLSDDLKRFRELTMGHHLIVGRKTYDSIGRPLPGRHIIVVTRNKSYKPDNVVTVHSLQEALSLAEDAGESEVFIGGGAEIYKEALPLADRMYVTRVEADAQADTFFPELDPSDWMVKQIGEHPADDRNQYPFSVWVMERRG